MRIRTCLVTGMVSGTEVNVTMDGSGRWTMPISTRLVSSGNEINARVFLDVFGHHDFSMGVHPNDTLLPLDIADSIMIDDTIMGRIVIPTEHVLIPTVLDPELGNSGDASIGVAFGSNFSRIFERIIITPTGDTGSGLLVLNPVTPEQYAHEGRWFHVNSLTDQFLVIEAAVAIGDYSASCPSTFVLVTHCNHTSIPREAFEDMITHIEQAGFNVVNDTDANQLDTALTDFRIVIDQGYASLYLPPFSASELARILPPIHFELEEFRLTIFPEDYLQSFSSGHILSISSYNEDGINMIGTNVLRRFALQLDYINHRIGFADPVDEV